MRIIPAIDILGGKCVRLVKGDYNTQEIYSEHPLEVAKTFEAAGIQYVHLVDLDGARSKSIVNYKILENIATNTRLTIDFGGGIKTRDDIRIAFDSGAVQVNIGSIAIEQPALFEEWLQLYGHDRIILSADCRNRMIATTGWITNTDRDVLALIRTYKEKKLKYVTCTDIDCDGALGGPNIELYRDIAADSDIMLIASGGISTIEDLQMLRTIGCEGAIVGKAIYKGRITLSQIRSLC